MIVKTRDLEQELTRRIAEVFREFARENGADPETFHSQGILRLATELSVNGFFAQSRYLQRAGVTEFEGGVYPAITDSQSER